MLVALLGICGIGFNAVGKRFAYGYNTLADRYLHLLGKLGGDKLVKANNVNSANKIKALGGYYPSSAIQSDNCIESTLSA